MKIYLVSNECWTGHDIVSEFLAAFTTPEKALAYKEKNEALEKVRQSKAATYKFNVEAFELDEAEHHQIAHHWVCWIYLKDDHYTISTRGEIALVRVLNGVVQDDVELHHEVIDGVERLGRVTVIAATKKRAVELARERSKNHRPLGPPRNTYCEDPDTPEEAR